MKRKQVLSLFGVLYLGAFLSLSLPIRAARTDTGNVLEKTFENCDNSLPIKGVIVDREGQPIIGGVVLVEGTNRKAISNDRGEFEITADKGATLVCKYLGYNDQSGKIADQRQIKVTMTEQQQKLNDIVVVGYSTNKKVNLSGSVASLNAKELSSRPITNLSTVLQGMAPGVTVTTQTGEPGANVGNIRIRGIGTFGGDSAAPLVLIDGVEGKIDEVDPNVIESDTDHYQALRS